MEKDCAGVGAPQPRRARQAALRRQPRLWQRYCSLLAPYGLADAVNAAAFAGDQTRPHRARKRNRRMTVTSRLNTGLNRAGPDTDAGQFRAQAGPGLAPGIEPRRLARYHVQRAAPLLLPRPRQFQYLAKAGLDARRLGGIQDRLLRRFRRARLDHAIPRSASTALWTRTVRKLLQPGQQPYTALGELYGQFRLTDEILATVGRRGFDTPFINTQDSLMTPNTFVVYAVQGAMGSTGRFDDFAFRGGYVDKIKPRNAQDFESMATAAGAPSGVDRGVYVAGANYKTGAVLDRRGRLLQRRYHQHRLHRDQIRHSACPTG